MENVLISGIGGVGGVNFSAALACTKQYRIFGTDYFKLHQIFPEATKVFSSPKHTDPQFIPTLRKIIKEQKISFLHCFPTSEALQVRLLGVPCKTLLPTYQAMTLAFDKYESTILLTKAGIKTPKLYKYEEKDYSFPVWIRARRGAGGARSLCCYDQEDINAWLHIWSHYGENTPEDYVIQEYVKGSDIAWDSLWFNGKLLASFARERVEYHSRGLGKGGSPTAARIIHDESVNSIGVSAVKALDEKPHGFYCIDLLRKESEVYVTEVNIGKAHTTLPLWGLAMQKRFGNLMFNLAYLYTELGLGHFVSAVSMFDIYPEDYFLVRDVDCGSWLYNEKDGKIRIDK